RRPSSRRPRARRATRAPAHPRGRDRRPACRRDGVPAARGIAPSGGRPLGAALPRAHAPLALPGASGSADRARDGRAAPREPARRGADPADRRPVRDAGARPDRGDHARASRGRVRGARREEDAAPRELHRSRGIRDRAPADPGGARGRASSARAGGDDGVGAPSLPRPLPRGRARADARRIAPGRRPKPGAVARRAHGARVMHSVWLRVGDHAVSYTDPQWLPLAAGAVVFVVAALITHVRRRAAWRDGRIASTEAVRLWLATLLRTAAYLCVVAALAGIAI